MPYIIEEKRKEIAPHIKSLLEYIKTVGELSPGDLNYIVTLTIIEYYRRNKCYSSANDVKGALGLAVDEFRRRVIDGYENKKIFLNGDVYPNDVLPAKEFE